MNMLKKFVLKSVKTKKFFIKELLMLLNLQRRDLLENLKAGRKEGWSFSLKFHGNGIMRMH